MRAMKHTRAIMGKATIHLAKGYWINSRELRRFLTLQVNARDLESLQHTPKNSIHIVASEVTAS